MASVTGIYPNGFPPPDPYYQWADIKLNVGTLPEPLKALDQWVLWKATPRGNGAGMNKIPFQPNGRNAKSNDPSTWSDYSSILEAYDEGGYTGIGFVLSDQDNFFGLDFDHCRDHYAGEIDRDVQRAIDALRTYTEVSPSGAGIRVIGRGTLPPGRQVNSLLEMYQAGRFLTITGEIVSNLLDIKDVEPDLLIKIRDHFIPKAEKTKPDSNDPILTTLQSEGLVQHQIESGVWAITCPWVNEHTDGDTTGTRYLAANYNGHQKAAFHCHHAHCAERNLADLQEWLGISKREYSLIWLAEAKTNISQIALIRGLAKPGTMLVTYGESNSGKSFSVIDRDICLAMGRTWFDRETEPGLVIYVAAEGAHSVEDRVAAYRDAYIDNATDIPFAILPQPLDLLKPSADVEPLIEFIKALEAEKGLKCIKVTADTLSRVMAGGNENAPEDMGRLVSNADRIRHEIGCCFEFIHHSGKDTAKGARGHSLLRAATDTEIEVTNKDGTHIARVTKQRDFPTGDEFAFSLRQVVLGEDNYGHSITTCVPEWHLDHKPVSTRDLTKQEHRVLAMIQEVIKHTKKLAPSEVIGDSKNNVKPGQFVCPLEVLRAHVVQVGGISDSDKADTQQRALRRSLQSLQDKELIRIYEDYAWLTDKADMGGQK